MAPVDHFSCRQKAQFNEAIGKARPFLALTGLKFILTLHFKVLFDMLRFHRAYFLLSLILLGIEVFIAECMHDAIIRPYGGDFLCVILLYCLIRTFWRLPVRTVAVGVLLFAYFVEATQYFGLADRLGFTRPSLIRTLMGYYFTWVDIGCYTLGILTVGITEKIIKRYG
jgi:hypothetical protein